MPFVWMISTSLKFPGDVMTSTWNGCPARVTFGNYEKMFTEYPVARWFLNSVFVSVISTGLNIVFGAMAGYALARLRFPGRDCLFFLFVASLMVPTEVTVVPLLLAIIKIGWWNSYQALICQPLTYVYSVYIFRQFFLSFPRDLEDAAKMDGASHFLIFWRIAFPLARAPHDRSHRHRVHLQLEQLPVAAAGGVRREHEDPARRHRRLRARYRHAHPAGGLRLGHGRHHDPERAELCCSSSSCSATSFRVCRAERCGDEITTG